MKTIIIAISLCVAVIGCGTPGKTVRPTPRNQEGIDFRQTGTVQIRHVKTIQAKPAGTVQDLLSSRSGSRASDGGNLLISSNVELRLNVADADVAYASMNDISAEAGGFVLLSNNKKSEVRVPAESLAEFLKKIGNMGRLTFQQIRQRNVTDHHSRLEINLDNAQKARQRFLVLMEMAETVDEVIKIEKELARESGQIDRMKRDLQSIKNQIAYAHVIVHLSSPSVAKPGPVGYIFYSIYKGASWLFVHD